MAASSERTAPHSAPAASPAASPRVADAPRRRAGILLLNVGTPDAPEPRAVRRYLREFLSDPKVIDLPAPARFLLLEAVILPFRPARSAAAYAKIWTAAGSPLLVHGRALRDALADALPGASVALGMRYQSPSIATALRELVAGCGGEDLDELVVLPMFPQYSDAAWATAVLKTVAEAAALRNVPSFTVVPPFYEHPAFLDATAHVARPFVGDVGSASGVDKVMFSFHGLPERQVRRSDTSGGRHCLQSADCCARIVDANRFCYRAQCYATARGIASRLGLEAAQWEVAFQSRLGRTPWIRPYTDVRLTELPREGVKRLAVLCPSFVADCLETVEEIGIRGRDAFLAAGGQELRAVPCVNADPVWVDGLASLLRERAPVLRS